MLGLAIHTSSPQLGLMLKSVDSRQEDAVERHQVWDLGREVSSQLHVKMMEFMEPHNWQDLSFVAVAKGPGGFTGTRVGVVAARTLAQQLNIPLFGVSTLAALAAGAQAAPQDIAVMMPAKREAVFGGIYRPGEKGDLQPVLDDSVMPADEWAAVADSWERPLVSVQAAMGAGIAASVTGVMGVAIARWHLGQRPDWSSVLPFYGQHPVHR
ncbi:MAG: tRNA (adenosine(37)-N6)-threonylcarbamoyltransferase complex dimerization subunit type 1 TsaB [Cyanobacteria bacterium J06598_3]